MSIADLEALSPLDGRYASKTAALRPFFSESALIRYRIRVEVAYLQALCRIPLPQLNAVDPKLCEQLDELWQQFKTADATRVKELEVTTNHDIKAVEYFIKEQIGGFGLSDISEYIHFGLTSQDINNTAFPLCIKDALKEVIYPELDSLLKKLKELSSGWQDIPMLARTHGQPASPTRLGKEIDVFITRIEAQMDQLKQVPNSAKFGGATGNFNAHHVAYPDVDWQAFADDFIAGLGLSRSHPTTQIEHYDNLAAQSHALFRINTILLDLCKDFWTYISMGYLGQKIVKGEVGSSAMPHKVNPIDFENAEGNLGLANALLGHLAAKLPVSRLQRDLSDSTVIRNVGVPIGHIIVALKSLQKGLSRIVVNTVAINNDLNNNWAVVAEAIQTVLRREGYPKPYETLKALTRKHRVISKETITGFINDLEVSDACRKELLSITPENYTGL